MKKFPNLGIFCTYADAIYSETALRWGLLDNTPTDEEYEQMRKTYTHIIAPIGFWINEGRKKSLPLLIPGINSFFRSGRPQKKINGIWHSVNSIVGGSPTSEHRNGGGVDVSLKHVATPYTNIDLAKFGKERLSFDQLLIENINPVTKKPAWVHFGYRDEERNRQQIKEVTFKNGKPKYHFLA